jgi:hypothetical protein
MIFSAPVCRASILASAPKLFALFQPSLGPTELSPSDNDIRAHLENVFARPEFSPSYDPLRWLKEWLLKLLHLLGGLEHTSPILFWLLLAACVSLLLPLLAHIGWTAYRALAGTSRRHSVPAHDRDQQLRHSAECRQEALRRAAAADFTEAIRYLFLSLVYYFDENGRVIFQRSCTNREYLFFFADRPGLSAQLATFVDTLDDHWYGQTPTGQDRYEHCLRLYEDLM